MYACGPWKTARASTSREKSRHTGLPRATWPRSVPSGAGSGSSSSGMWFAFNPPEPSVTSAASECSWISRPRTSSRVSSKCAGMYMRLGRLARGQRNRGGRRQGRLLAPRLACPGPLVPLRRELGHEVRVARALDDGVELRAVVADEADALDAHVVDGPAPIAQEHAVVHRNLRLLLRHDPSLDDRQVALDGVAGVLDLLAGVALDLRDVRVLEEVAEERDELLALGGRAGLPVPAQAPPRDFREVEDLVHDRPDSLPALRRLGFLLELGVGDDLQDEVDGPAELVGGNAGAGVARREERHHGGDSDERAGHGWAILYRSGNRSHLRVLQHAARDRKAPLRCRRGCGGAPRAGHPWNCPRWPSGSRARCCRRAGSRRPTSPGALRGRRAGAAPRSRPETWPRSAAGSTRWAPSSAGALRGRASTRRRPRTSGMCRPSARACRAANRCRSRPARSEAPGSARARRRRPRPRAPRPSGASSTTRGRPCSPHPPPWAR